MTLKWNHRLVGFWVAVTVIAGFFVVLAGAGSAREDAIRFHCEEAELFVAAYDGCYQDPEHCKVTSKDKVDLAEAQTRVKNCLIDGYLKREP